MFTPYCPLAQQLTSVIAALHANKALLAGTPNLKWTIAAEILWQVTHATQHFFEHTMTYEQLNTNNRPRVDLSWLARDIQRGTFTQSLNRPSTFIQPFNKRDRDTNSPQKQGNKRQREEKRPKTQKEILTKMLPNSCATIIKNYRNQNNGLPYMAQVRNKLDIVTDADLAQKLGLSSKACMRYHLFGECGRRECPNTHESNIKIEDHTAILTKILSKG